MSRKTDLDPAFIEVAERMVLHRKLKGISQEEMAFRLNVSDRQYRRYENNESEIPISIVAAFCEELKIDSNYLIVGKVTMDRFIQKGMENMPERKYKSVCKHVKKHMDKYLDTDLTNYSNLRKLLKAYYPFYSYGSRHYRDEQIRECEDFRVFTDLYEGRH